MTVTQEAAPTDAVARHRWRPGGLEVFIVLLVLVAIFSQQLADLFASNPAVQTGATIFVSIIVQALPFLALGVILSGIITAFVPRPSGVERCPNASRWPFL